MTTLAKRDSDELTTHETLEKTRCTQFDKPRDCLYLVQVSTKDLLRRCYNDNIGPGRSDA